jgi:PAS domain S-box-containing protein
MTHMPAPVLGTPEARQNQRIALTTENQTFLQRLTHVATGLLPAAVGAISLVDERGETVVAAVGLDGHDQEHAALSWAASFWSEDQESGDNDPIVIMDSRHVSDDKLPPYLPMGEIVALAAVPLLNHASRIGTLMVADSTQRGWSTSEIQALQQLAAIAAASLNHSAATSLSVPAERPGVTDLETDRVLAQLRRSFDDGLAGHAVANAEGRILACNAELARIVGFASVEEAIATNLYELEPKGGAFQQLLERLSQISLIPLEELRITRRDGTPAQVLARLAATTDAIGKVSEVRVYLVDITRHFLLEEKLRESADRLSLLELATHDVLWDWDLANGTLKWNEMVARRFRYTPEEVRTTPDWHIERIHADDRERVVRSLERATHGVDSAWSDEYRLRRGDGTYATVLDRAHIVRDARGEPVRMVGVILDISELKSSEDAQRFLARASAAFGTSLDVDATATKVASLCVPMLADLCLVDLKQPDGTLRRVAAAHADPLREQFLGLGATLRDDARQGAHKAAESRDTRIQTHIDEDLLAALGVTVEAGLHACVVLPITARGHLLGAMTFGFTDTRPCSSRLDLMTARDLVQRAGLALENAMLYATAQHAVNIRNDVLGVVSHDLRVPLNTMMATLSLLSDTMRDRRKEARDWFDILYRATAQMRVLIEDLLDASRMESEHFTINRTQSHVSGFIEEACDMLRPLAARKNITIETDVADDLPKLSVDTPKLVRVVANLLGNAIKFSPRDGKIRVAAVLCGGEVQISVRDRGDGIPPDQLMHVFDRFWSGHAADRRGAGLGLTIAKGIVEAHGGRIWVKSRKNEGSTFTFAVPLHELPAHAQLQTAEG